MKLQIHSSRILPGHRHTICFRRGGGYRIKQRRATSQKHNSCGTQKTKVVEHTRQRTEQKRTRSSGTFLSCTCVQVCSKDNLGSKDSMNIQWRGPHAASMSQSDGTPRATSKTVYDVKNQRFSITGVKGQHHPRVAQPQLMIFL
jgi:hypothetical protein